MSASLELRLLKMEVENKKEREELNVESFEDSYLAKSIIKRAMALAYGDVIRAIDLRLKQLQIEEENKHLYDGV